MLQRFSSETEQATFTEQLAQLRTIEVNDEVFPATLLGKGGFGVTLKVEVPNRSVVLKLFIAAGHSTASQIARETTIHNEVQLRVGLKYSSGANDRDLFKVISFTNGILKLERIDYTDEYVGEEIIATMQDFDEGMPLTQWNPTDLDDLVDITSDFAHSLDVFEVNGVAEPDRNPNNVFVKKRHRDNQSRITHIDFGLASMVKFNVITLFKLIRKPELFDSPQKRIVFLIEVLRDFVSHADGFKFNPEEDLMETLKTPTFVGVCKLMLVAIARSSVPRRFEELTPEILELDNEEANIRLATFDEILNTYLPVEKQSQINFLLNKYSFSRLISHYFSQYNSNIDWTEILGEDKSYLVNDVKIGFDNTFGHPLAPCPPTILGKVDYTDMKQVAACATYEMMWTFFTKLVPGVYPIKFDEHTLANIKNIGVIAFAFVMFEVDGIFPIIEVENFIKAAKEPQSVLFGYDEGTLTKIHCYFKEFFSSFHLAEVFDQKSYRDAYPSATHLTDKFKNIVSMEKTEA